jgi:N-succinyl-L-ornithine transcarbamylase
MDQKNAEHIKDAAGVVGTYADLLAVRAFPSLKDKSLDYSEPIINAYKKYAGIPLLNLESGARHPLQALADMISIESLKKTHKPKVVLSWAPHPRVLPQSVANSFAAFSNAMEYDVHVCHPEGYALDAEFVEDAKIHHSQEEAFKEADFIYAKNWSSTEHYGTNDFNDKDWMIDEEKMATTNNGKFMHCLPVRRNVVVTDEVIDSKNSITQIQAANRIIAAQIVLKKILENG